MQGGRRRPLRVLKGIAYKTHTVPAPINRVQQPKWAYPTLHCINFLVWDSTHTHIHYPDPTLPCSQSVYLTLRPSVRFFGWFCFFFCERNGNAFHASDATPATDQATNQQSSSILTSYTLCTLQCKGSLITKLYTKSKYLSVS